METAPLKSFATWARLELITQVSARMAAVLAPASPERIENQNAVVRLERDIVAAGGGTKGRDAVADKVAYTWFNRIIALRFMDANGYTGVGIVSPAHGQVIGQPEILADAKRGNIDPAVVSNKRTLDAITGLLDGTRPSADAQGEAYTLLLAEYCRYWNRSMPFMFEGDGDYTELLIPANLLAADSILTKATETLTEEVCLDVEVIGWLYQFYISQRKDDVFKDFKKGKKANAEEIPAATQLFTPHWIVRYLAENSIGRLWALNHPESQLVEKMDYYIAPVDDETDFLRIDSPEELTVIDPACGSGHMLTYAFDLLYTIYEEEGYAPSEIPELILTNNLYGTEIDQRAGSLAAFALTMKARARQRTFFSKDVQPNICVLEPISFSPDELDFLLTDGGNRSDEEAFWNQFENADLFGSLIRPNASLTAELSSHLRSLDNGGNPFLDHTLTESAHVIKQAEYLARRYTVAIANPPYMGAKNMSAPLSQFMKLEYPDSKSDLFAAFIERCADLTARGGASALITMQSWMFLSSYEKLRHSLLRHQQITSMLHLGARAFDSIGGEVVSSTAFVLGRPATESFIAIAPRNGVFIRLVDGTSEAEKIAATRNALTRRDRDSGYYLASSQDFISIPGSPIVYWLSEKMHSTFKSGKPLGDIAEPRRGLDTGDNSQFVRLWWEVSVSRSVRTCANRDVAERSGSRWFPFNKGGDYRKWWGNQELVVNWEQDGARIRDASKVPGARPQNLRFYFRPTLSWSRVTGGEPSFRFYPTGSIFSSNGPALYAENGDTCRPQDAGVLNSNTAKTLLQAIAPTMDFQTGQIAQIHVPEHENRRLANIVRSLTHTACEDWNASETSWDFRVDRLILLGRGGDC